MPALQVVGVAAFAVVVGVSIIGWWTTSATGRRRNRGAASWAIGTSAVVLVLGILLLLGGRSQ